ncbi:MAG: hypothetical protein GQ565_07355 [Candidatus Aegiribacteria sp.]|nr:hypothetical protein [Candidatus Aegiribacteria sp.]
MVICHFLFYFCYIPVSDVEGVAPAHVAEAEVVVLSSVGSLLDCQRAGVEVTDAGDCPRILITDNEIPLSVIFVRQYRCRN